MAGVKAESDIENERDRQCTSEAAMIADDVVNNDTIEDDVVNNNMIMDNIANNNTIADEVDNNDDDTTIEVETAERRTLTRTTATFDLMSLKRNSRRAPPEKPVYSPQSMLLIYGEEQPKHRSQPVYDVVQPPAFRPTTAPTSFTAAAAAPKYVSSPAARLARCGRSLRSQSLRAFTTKSPLPHHQQQRKHLWSSDDDEDDDLPIEYRAISTAESTDSEEEQQQRPSTPISQGIPSRKKAERKHSSRRRSCTQFGRSFVEKTTDPMRIIIKRLPTTISSSSNSSSSSSLGTSSGGSDHAVATSSSGSDEGMHRRRAMYSMRMTQALVGLSSDSADVASDEGDGGDSRETDGNTDGGDSQDTGGYTDGCDSRETDGNTDGGDSQDTGSYSDSSNDIKSRVYAYEGYSQDTGSYSDSCDGLKTRIYAYGGYSTETSVYAGGNTARGGGDLINARTTDSMSLCKLADEMTERPPRNIEDDAMLLGNHNRSDELMPQVEDDSMPQVETMSTFVRNQRLGNHTESLTVNEVKAGEEEEDSKDMSSVRRRGKL